MMEQREKMQRRAFFQRVGALAGAAVVAPEMVKARPLTFHQEVFSLTSPPLPLTEQHVYNAMRSNIANNLRFARRVFREYDAHDLHAHDAPMVVKVRMGRPKGKT